MVSRKLFLHIGTAKTGTSALQRAIWGSKADLAGAGLAMPLVGRRQNVAKMLHPLGWVIGRGFERPVDRDGLRQLSERVARFSGDRVLFSNEDLAELPADRVSDLLRACGAQEAEAHMVLTLRGLGAVIPSEWQHFLRHRLTDPYPEFLADVRDQRGFYAQHFWRRQDVVAICQRWESFIQPDRIHLIIVPQYAADPDAIFRMFGKVIGVDPALMKRSSKKKNASLGLVEAEVYRRLNVALGDRLMDPHAYQSAVRQPLLRGILARGASAPIRLPPEHVSWVRTAAGAQCDALRSRGYQVEGDLENLLPTEGMDPLPTIEESELADAAIKALANFAYFRFTEAKPKAAPQSQRRPNATPAPLPRSWKNFIRSRLTPRA